MGKQITIYKNLQFKVGHYGSLRRLTFYRRLSETVCFRRVSRREDNGETGKSSCLLIVTCLLKLSTQWVKYALGCVYTDLPIGELKKKKKKNAKTSET